MSITIDSVSPTRAASGNFFEQKGVRSSLGSLVIEGCIVLLGQFNSGFTPTANAPQLVSSAEEVAARCGRGSMLHLMAKRSFDQAPTTKQYIAPLADAVSSTAATGTIVLTGTATKAGTMARFIGGKKLSIPVAVGDTHLIVAARIKTLLDAALDFPVTVAVTTGTATLTAKFKGTLGNSIRIQKDLDTGDFEAEPSGLTEVITQMASGAGDPDPTTALAALGGLWATAIASPYADATGITALEGAGASRSDPATVNLPFMGIFGYTGSRADFVIAVTARNSKFVSWVPVEDSPMPSFEIAASAAALYASRQETAPGTPMRARKLVGIRAGAAAAWTGTEEDAVVKAGGSTTRGKTDGTVQMQDFVTTYKTNAAGAPDDLYRFTCWLGNWQFKLNSLNGLYNADPFIDALVVDDKAKTDVDYAISPKIVKAFAIQLVDELWVKYGLTKERDAVVKGIKTEIDAGNPGRINLLIPDVFSAGLRIIAGKVQWSFYAPAQAA